MNFLVIFCHPKQDSFANAICQRAVETLQSSGHDVQVIDLYKSGFDPVLSAQEWDDYEIDGDNQKTVSDHVALLTWAEGLVFIYPTWWYGLPAIMKGWLDRVFVPGVTFTIPREGEPVRPKLQKIRRIAAITTCGATWWVSKFVGEPGRKTILRGIRALCSPGCKTLYLAHYKMDTANRTSLEAYLAKIRRKINRFAN